MGVFDLENNGWLYIYTRTESLRGPEGITRDPADRDGIGCSMETRNHRAILWGLFELAAQFNFLLFVFQRLVLRKRFERFEQLKRQQFVWFRPKSDGMDKQDSEKVK